MLNKPDVKLVPKDVWTKVASSVTVGKIHQLRSLPSLPEYIWTTRAAGQDPPLAADIPEGVALLPRETLVLSFAAVSDVYYMALGVDGKVRADV